VALIAAVMLTMLLSVLVAAVILGTTVDSGVAANFRARQQVSYAAEAAVEHVVRELETVADWTLVLSGVVVSGLPNTGPSVLPDGTPVDPAALTRVLQEASDEVYGWTADRPIWRLFASAPLSALWPAEISASDYLFVWVADDDREQDGDPLTDTNQTMLIRAEAYGERGSRGALEVSIGRPPPSGVGGRARLLTWREGS
jgi:hypothetical protein